MPLLVQENFCSTFEQLRLSIGLDEQNQFTHLSDSYQVKAQILESDKKVTSFDFVPPTISSPFAVIEEIKNSLIKEKLPSLSFTQPSRSISPSRNATCMPDTMTQTLNLNMRGDSTCSSGSGFTHVRNKTYGIG